MRPVTALATLLLVVSCTPGGAAVPTIASATATSTPSASPARTAPQGIDALPTAAIENDRAWYTVPDGLDRPGFLLVVNMGFDAAPGAPRARVRETGGSTPLTFNSKSGTSWMADIDLRGMAPGAYTLDVVVRMRDGSDRAVATQRFVLSQPIYVVWTLDFEGDAATDDALRNTAAIADQRGIPMTLMWNPRVWTTSQVTAERADAMRAWTMARADRGDEIALHIHAWTDFVRAAGVSPRTSPSWAGRGDGYDVPLTAFDEAETAKLLDHAMRLMAEHGMPRPTSFRAGGLFANAANLRAVAAAGFSADTSATPGGPFGALQLPWTLPAGAQPYRPSRTDANATGDLPLLEVPNNAGNTFGYTTASIQRIVSDDLAMLPAAGEIATERRVLTLVSHPATIDATERAAIEKLFAALDPYRFDRGTGPLRFVTLSQLAKAFGP